MKRKFTLLLMALLALTGFRSWGQTQTRTAYHGASPSKDVKTEAVLSAVKAPANVASSDRAVRGDSQLTYCSSTTFSGAIGLNNTTTYIEWAAAFRPSMFTANDNYITSVDFYAYQAGNYTLKIYDGDAAASVPTNAIYEHNYNITTPGTWVNLEVVNQIVAIDHTKALWVAIGNTDALYPAAYTSEVLSTTDCCMMYYSGEWLAINELGSFNLSPWMIVANTTSDNPGIQCEAISTFPYFNDFEDFVSNHDCWISIDNDGDGQDWITGTTQSGAFNGYNSSTGLVSKSYDYNGSSVSYDADNYLLSPEFELPDGYIVTLSWYAKSSYSGDPDWYEVMIAPNGSTDINDFVQIFDEDGPADWAQRTADISAYAGTTVRVVFHHQDAEQYWILIDNLGIETAFDCDPIITEFPYFNDFENFLNEKDCWIDIDNDGDGYGWFTDTEANWGTGSGVNNSNCLVSQSYENYVGARDADNYLVSPEFELPTTVEETIILSWFEQSLDPGYPDSYEVMIAPNGSTEISDFVSIYNGVAANPWTERTADISAYAGTTVRVVFHHQSSDCYILAIDNVEVGVKRAYNITYDNVNIQHGSINGPKTAYAGQTVTLSAIPATGYELGAWIVTNVTTSEPIAVVNNQFIMPTSDVTVTATFVYHPTLTVNDGTNTNSYVPIYGYYADGYCKSQFIIPASALGDMLGGTVSDMTFYLNSSSSISFTGTWDVYVKEVDNTTLSGFVSWSELGSAVYHGNMTITNGQLTVNFTAPITYNGNNLLIGFNETVSGNYPSTSWLGVSQSSNTAWYSTYSNTGNPQQFLPKTTFGYTPNPNLHHITVTQPVEGGTISAPASAISGTTVTLTATPELGYEFGEWIVSPSSVTITGNTFEMPASDVTVTATFNEVTQYGIAFVGIDEALITVAATFGGETITEAPAGTEVTLEYSDLNIGYTFGNWTLNGEALAGNTFIMPAEAVEVGVVLNERPRFAVTIDEAITNGTITAEPSSEILGGTLVTLTITPETGYTLDVLTVTDGESNPVAVTNNTFTMPESNVTVTATFVHGITVYDGTNTNNQVPVYGSYADSDYKSQFIFPAEDLEAMAGGIINSMTFYASEEYVAIPGTWSVYVSEVENTTLSGLEDWANLDAVLEGATITISGHQMTVNFATPFLYNGGNLLIGFNETNSGSYTNTTWYGVTQTTNTAYYWYEYYSVSEGPIQFLPKTTFLYTPVTPYTVNLHVNGVVSEEEVSILPTPENIPAGMTFCGWTNSDIATYTTEAPSYVTKATADGEDFYAVFSYSEMGGATAWTKVTDFLELNDNDVVIIGAVQNGNSGYTMNEFSEMGSSATCPALPATFSNDGTTITELHEGTTHFTVTKYPYNDGNIYLQGESGKNLSSFWTYNLNIPAGWEETVGDEYNDIITFDNGKLIISYNDDWDELYVILRNIDQYGGINMRFGVEQIQPGYYDAAYLYKQQGALATYYMTEVFVIDEATSLTEDMTKRNVIIADGASLNINANVTLNVAGACFNPSHDAAQLVVAEGGQLIHNNTGVLATMKKNIAEANTRDSKWSDWYTISSPLAADETAFADVTNLIPSNVTDTDYDLYRLDEKYGIWENARVTEGVAFTTIDKGRGYLYARKDNAQLAFAGEINVANVECTLTNDAAHGFNLIGNPFMQNITLDNVDGTAELADGFYVLSNEGDWGSKLTSSPIKPLQGFLVQATTAGTATISKPTAAPSKGERSGHNTNIEMIVSNSNHRDNAYAVFGEGIGLNKVNHRNAQAPMLYVPQDGEDFAIAFMDENTTVFPLNFKAMTTGNYSISLKATDDINTLVLVDNMTGVETNMLLEGSYSFIGSPADNDSRFTVKLSISHSNGQADSEHFVYQNGSELVVNGEGTLQIFDILGRVVVSEEVHGQTVNVGGLTTGAYIVRMTGNEVKTQKIIIR